MVQRRFKRPLHNQFQVYVGEGSWVLGQASEHQLNVP